ncbi:hypothetical protein ATN79_05290 [Paraburkholderia caribensis]|nr:hypothetical protein ATN79_05290 [Paraburkholderia caribensis]
MAQNPVGAESVKSCDRVVAFDCADGKVSTDDNRCRDAILLAQTRQVGQIFQCVPVQAADQYGHQVVSLTGRSHELLGRRACAQVDYVKTLSAQVHCDQMIAHHMGIACRYAEDDGATAGLNVRS